MVMVAALIEALGCWEEVAVDIPDDQRGRPSACTGWTVDDVLRHSGGVISKFAAFAAGVTDHPRSPPAALVPVRDRAEVRSLVAGARRAWATTDLTRVCHLSFGSFPAELAAGINLFDTLAHTWDMAVGRGVSFDCEERLWVVGLEAARVVIAPRRDPAHYAPAVPPTGDASARQRFLAYLGRVDG